MTPRNKDTEDQVRIAAFVAVGLGLINIGIIMFFAILILKGSLWIAH